MRWRDLVRTAGATAMPLPAPVLKGLTGLTWRMRLQNYSKASWPELHPVSLVGVNRKGPQRIGLATGTFVPGRGRGLGEFATRVN